MTTFEYAMELVLCGLLLAGIFYSIYLGRALAVLRRDRKELAELVAQLDESGRRAEDGVEKLQVAGDVSGRALGRMIDQSRMLQSELESLSERADLIAGRLEGLVRQGAGQTSTAAQIIPLSSVSAAAAAQEERHALRQEAESAAAKPPLSSLPASTGRSGASVAAAPRPYEQKARQRTEAEQDLIRALRMG